MYISFNDIKSERLSPALLAQILLIRLEFFLPKHAFCAIGNKRAAVSQQTPAIHKSVSASFQTREPRQSSRRDVAFPKFCARENTNRENGLSASWNP